MAVYKTARRHGRWLLPSGGDVEGGLLKAQGAAPTEARFDFAAARGRQATEELTAQRILEGYRGRHLGQVQEVTGETQVLWVDWCARLGAGGHVHEVTGEIQRTAIKNNSNASRRAGG
ncbi:unnamed protein product [Lampetra planeri]